MPVSSLKVKLTFSQLQQIPLKDQNKENMRALIIKLVCGAQHQAHRDWSTNRQIFENSSQIYDFLHYDAFG